MPSSGPSKIMQPSIGTWQGGVLDLRIPLRVRTHDGIVTIRSLPELPALGPCSIQDNCQFWLTGLETSAHQTALTCTGSWLQLGRWPALQMQQDGR